MSQSPLLPGASVAEETAGALAWGWASAWPAPAKLNLFLHVVGRRADGYHLLQTAFCFIDRADYLRFAPRADGRIVLATPLAGVPPDDDLTVRAARLLQKAVGGAAGVEIRLEKNLPLGGGLGGGSSDAATVLIALNHLWRLGLSRQQLQELGLALGADVPIFIHGQNAFAEGVGEKFSRLDPPLPPAHYLVLEPPVSVPTAAIFTAPDLPRQTPPLDVAAWRPGMGGNDLQAVACRLYPPIAEHLRWLAAYGEARMTGSGACVFAAFADAAAGQRALAALPKTMRGWLARGLSEHPLAGIERCPD